MKTNTILSLLLAGLILCACVPSKDSDKADPGKVEQKYAIRVTQANNGSFNTNVSATFRENHTLLKLNGRSEIRHQNVRMESDLYTQIKDIPGKVLDHTFDYVGNDGRSFRNTLKLLPIALPTGMAKEIPKDKPLRIVWIGEPLRSGETITLYVAHPESDRGYVYQSEEMTRVGATEIEMSASKLEGLPDGATRITLSRSITLPLQEGPGDKQGSIEGSLNVGKLGFTLR